MFGIDDALLIGGGLNLLGGLLGGKQKNDQANAQAKVQNRYLDDYKAGQNNFLDYFKGLGPQTSTSTSTGNSNSVTNGSFSNQGNTANSSVSNPFVTSEFSPLVGMTKNILERRLAGPDGLPPGFAESAIRGINDSYAGADQSAANAAARFGVSGPQALALAAPSQRARAGQIADFRANMPLQARSLQNQDIQMAQTLASIFGKGEQSNSMGTSNQTGTNRSNTSGSTTSNSSNTGPAPIAPMAAFLPPGPQSVGAVDPTINLVTGGLGSAGDLFSAWAQQKARQDYLNALSGNNTGIPGFVTPTDSGRFF